MKFEITLHLLLSHLFCTLIDFVLYKTQFSIAIDNFIVI